MAISYTDAINLSADDSDKEYYAYIRRTISSFDVQIFGNVTQKELAAFNFKTSIKLITDIPQMFEHGKIKAIILEIDGMSSILGDKYELVTIRAIKSQLDLLQKPYYFVSGAIATAGLYLVGANVSLNYGEVIVIIVIEDVVEKCGVYELRYTKNGYERIDFRLVSFYLLDALYHDGAREKLLGDNNPSKIIIHCDTPANQMTNQLTEILSDDLDNITVLEEYVSNFYSKFVIEASKWLIDPSYTRFHVLPRTGKRYMLGYETSKELILTDDVEYVPYSKSEIVPKSDLTYFIGFYPDGLPFFKPEMLETFTLPQKCHACKITFDIDINNIPSYKVAPVLKKVVTSLPTNLNKITDLKLPVIGFYCEMSVICINKNDEDGYQFLDSWNGKLGKDLYISFYKAEPQFFENAVAAFKVKKSTVVRKLLTLASFKRPDGEFKDIKWMGYTVAYDKTNGIMLKFKNFDGTEKSATLDFLMGLLLKEHIKAIAEEIGEEPKKLAFSVLAVENDEEKKRIEDVLKKSCKMLSIECCFVEGESKAEV